MLHLPQRLKDSSVNRGKANYERTQPRIATKKPGGGSGIDPQLYVVSPAALKR